MDVNLRSLSLNHIDVLITDGIENSSWYFTGFYEAPTAVEQKYTWDLLH